MANLAETLQSVQTEDRHRYDPLEDDDSEWLDDPEVCALQNSSVKTAVGGAGGGGGGHPAPQLPAWPAHVTPNTHALILKTMRGSEAWRQNREEEEALS